ncbi:MAG TPA: hypothetical protein VGN17_05895 [Bryobacteraceae bacterium]
MVKLLMWSALVASLGVRASAADFTLTIGSTVAASGPAPVGAEPRQKVSKGGLFAVRMEGCEALDKAQISGTAEGISNGARVSAPVTLSAFGPPGVYVASFSTPQAAGSWIVSISASCESAKAGAVVPVGPAGFVREGTKIFAHAPTKVEVDAALKGIAGAGK